MEKSIWYQKPVLILKDKSFLANSAKKRIDVSDVKQLLLHPRAHSNRPLWATLENHHNVRCVVLVTVDGLSEVTVRENSAQFGKMLDIFERAIPVYIPYSLTSQKKVLRFYSRCTKAVRGLVLVTGQYRNCPNGGPSLPLEKYLLNAEQMVDNNYPLKSREFFKQSVLREDFISLDPPLSSAGDNRLLTRLENFSKVETLAVGNAAHIVAIDCEMVRTKNGLELARVTVSDFFGIALYDQIVRPEAPVVDYCTRFSGIDAELMAGATKRLKDVQTDLKKLIFCDTIICGHSLENDLEALKLYHERVIDTSLLYPHIHGPPRKFSLKNLSKMFLKRDIQQNRNNHNSAEDAKATLDLVKLKLSNGMAFGGQCDHFETIFSICRRFSEKTTLVAPAAVAKDLVGADSSVSVITAESPQKCFAAAKAILCGEKCSGFVWAVVGKEKCEDGSAGVALDPDQIDAEVAELYGATGGDTLFVVMSGHIEDKFLSEESFNEKRDQKSRKDWLINKSKEWPGEKAYRRKISNLKKGVCFVTMK